MSFRNLGMPERLEKAKVLLEDISSSLVLVEGKKDVAALRRLGIEATPYYNKREILKKERTRATILTDIDEDGDRICSYLEQELLSIGYKVDTHSRRKLASLLEIRKFEEIARRFESEVVIWQRPI